MKKSEFEEGAYPYPFVGEEFRYLLKAVGVTQKELVDVVGTSNTTLQHCLKGAIFG